ncbi:MAG: hypothetical protein LBE18_04410, partial [Planctomycetaceae bacterium]|nr:hypothetical protein [Planctomycetaceae bacterium]
GKLKQKLESPYSINKSAVCCFWQQTMEFNWFREFITVTESDRESDEGIVVLKSGNSDGAKAL